MTRPLVKEVDVEEPVLNKQLRVPAPATLSVPPYRQVACQGRRARVRS